MRVINLPAVRVEPEEIRMNGGMDLVTPPLQRKPGTCRTAQNFEQAINGGYRRIAGYERYDGSAKPSDATYTNLAATITGTAALGNVLTGATSGATGTIIALPGGAFILAKVTGTFISGENLTISAVIVAAATADPVIGAATTQLLNATYLNLAADVYRALIAAVPGSGKVLGVVGFNDIRYAFRNNAGGTASALYKSSATGWTAVPLGRQLSFTSAGTYTVAEGDIITGATSGATAVVTRVALTSGSLSAGTGAGKFIFSSQTGVFQAENLNVGASLDVATIAGDSTAITLLPGGRYEFVITNFGGAVTTNRIYGCDGVNKGFEFDGSVYVPIDTGMTLDAPSHVAEHQKQLFFSFIGSVQHAGPGTPYVWSAVLGASELGMGDTVTGFAKQPGSETSAALAIFTRNRTSILYGSGVANWLLVPYRDGLGAYAHTIQDVGKTVFLDDRGITDIRTAQQFGNFSDNILSDMVKPLINEFRIGAVASCISRDLNQYRLFFTSGIAFYMTLNMTLRGNKVVGTMQQSFPDVVRCVWSGEQADGAEVIFFGSDDGMVYQMERGTSFDGDPIEYFMDLAQNFSRSPRVIKHYRHAMLEVDGSSYAAFNFGFSLGYGTTDIDQPAMQSVVTNFSTVNWDSFNWDAFYWDGQTLAPSEIDMGGDAQNCSLAIQGSSDMYAPFTITGVIVHFTPRRMMR